MTELSKAIIDVILGIPFGKVLSYGEVARRAGSPRGARQVSYLLHGSSDKYDLPWHRVINSQGKISLKGILGEEQKSRLEAEGVVFNKDKIDLNEYIFDE